ARLGVGLALTALPMLLFGFRLGWLVVLVVIHYVCYSHGSVFLATVSVTDIIREDNKIWFTAREQASQGSTQFWFTAPHPDIAIAIEKELFKCVGQPVPAQS